MSKFIKVLVLSLLVTTSLVGCNGNKEPLEGFTSLSTHEQIASDYDNLKSGHKLFEYSGEDFAKIINLDRKTLVYIGRPT